MALPKAMFANDNATAVQMPNPLNCIFHIRPLKPKVRAEWEKRKGLTIEGFAESGDVRTVRASFDPLKDLAANVWLAHKLVDGWDGFKVAGDGDIEEPLPFSSEALDEVASDPMCFNLIFAEAEKLSGKRKDAELGN